MRILLILLLVISCSTSKRDSAISETQETFPEWIYNPATNCDSSVEFCSSGEGQSFNLAEDAAKKNLKAIFAVRPVLDLSSYSNVYPWIYEIEQEIASEVEEIRKGLLTHVTFKSRHQKEALFYVLGSLEKNKVRTYLGKKIKKKKKQLKGLWASKQRITIKRMIALSLQIEHLNALYAQVSDKISNPVSFQIISEWYRTLPVNIPISIKVGQAPDWIVEKVKTLLQDSGYEVLKNNPSKILTIQVNSIKEFIEGEDFEKYTFTLNLTHLDKDQKYTVQTTETMSGRTQGEALLKLRPYFNKYLERSLGELKLD